MDTKILYKFRNWENDFHKKILKEQEIYFASIAEFNDPFDSDIMFNYEELTESEQIQRIKDHVEYDYPQLILMEKEHKVRELWEDSSFKKPGMFEKNFRNHLKPKLEREFGIFSLAGNKSNLLLWSHYANGHEGFCVGFGKNHLMKLIEETNQNNGFMFMEEIYYDDDYPNINPVSLNDREYVSKLFNIKSKVWKYEEEERMILKINTNRKINLPKSCYAEIILGCRMSKKIKREILNTVRNEFEDLPVYQARKSKKQFALVFEKIFRI